MPSFSFEPTAAPHPNLVATYGSDLDPVHIEVFDHLRQLGNAIACGDIGPEWFAELVQIELARIGW